MKKLLIGCGVVALLIGLAIAGLVGYGVSVARKVGQEMQHAQEQIAATDTEFAFKAPADGLLPEDRLTAWIGAAQSIAQYDAETRDKIGSENGKNFRFSNAMHLVPESMEHTASALRQAKMSSHEYDWIKDQIEAGLVSDEARAKPTLVPLAVALGRNAATSSTAQADVAAAPGASVDVKVVSLSPDQKKHLADLLDKHAQELLPLVKPIFQDGTMFNNYSDLSRSQRFGRMNGNAR